jgi:hypothetical protein
MARATAFTPVRCFERRRRRMREPTREKAMNIPTSFQFDTKSWKTRWMPFSMPDTIHEFRPWRVESETPFTTASGDAGAADVTVFG